MFTVRSMFCRSLCSAFCIFCLNAMLISRLSSISLNMPSSLDVKPPPHSCFSFDSIDFSASTEADLPTSSRLARSFL
uniref:Putative secreted protein n=1 Tax=Anopheles darlingi TaxID=43151 RepID=A0A2M4DJL8_ANODA